MSSVPAAHYAAPLPQTTERNRGALRGVLVVGGALGVAATGMLMLLVIGVSVGPVAFATGLVLAAVPVPIYLGLALWIDRFEPEPLRLLLWTFFWGASAATLIALIVNSVGQAIVGSAFGSAVGELYGGSISAPIVEESAKAVVLIAIYRWRRHEFNGVLDGILYAAIVGLGFAFTENILYYGNSATGEDGVPVEATFFLRGVVSPFAHPVFTAMTGIGLGLAVSSSRQGRRIYPVLGLFAAILLHSLWNTGATVGGGLGFIAVYVLIMVPIFISLIVVVIVARRREGRAVRQFLEPELQSGVLTAEEVAGLSSMKGRRRAGREAKRAGGRARRRTLRELHRVATELAFLRQAMTRRPETRTPAALAAESGHLRRLQELGRELDPTRPAPRASPTPAALAAPAQAAAPSPAGWYPDPYRQARLRYWDGSGWTGHAAP